MKSYIPRFDSLYRHIEDFSIIEKENKKYYFVEKLKSDLRNKKFKNPKYLKFINSNIEVNNAYLLSYRRYSGHQQILRQQLENKYDGDILKMLDFYQKNFDSL
jgi:hypothetical protein